MPDTEPYTYEGGWYVQTTSASRLKSYTAYCGKKKEGYEEVDVRALGPAPAKRIVQAVLDEEYEGGMKVAKLIFRPEGFMFL